MNNKLINKKNVFSVLIKLLPAAVIVIIAVFSPCMVDDWAWGTSVGDYRLNTFFADYNGRYLGNLFIYALMRCQALWVISVPAAITVLAVCAHKITGVKRLGAYFMLPMLLMIMRTDMFRQAIVWRSGFSNYVPPIVFVLIYAAVITNVFADDAPRYNKYTPALTLIIGFCGALFMEHVTMYSVLLGIAVVVYTKIRFKKVYATHITYLAGALIGAVIMFTNTAYINILLGRDTNNYRTVGGASILDTVAANGTVISRWLIEYNSPLITVIFVLLTATTVIMIKNGSISRGKKAVVTAIVMYELLYVILSWALFITKGGIMPKGEYDALRFVLAVLCYVGFAVLASLSAAGRQERDKLLFLILSAGAVTVPLFVTTPVSTRCFFPSYILLAVFACVLFGRLIGSVSKKTVAALSAAVIIVFIALSVYYCAAYSQVHDYYIARNEYIEQQIAYGRQDISVPKIPKATRKFSAGFDYTDNDVWRKRFCDFYGIDIKTKRVTQCEWNL